MRENGGILGDLVVYTFDSHGRPAEFRYLNDQTGEFGFDGLSRVNAIDLDLASGANDLSYDFTYSPASEMVTETRSNAAYDWTGSAGAAQGYSANYLNQYLTAAGATITHDARGNLTFDGAKTFGYDAANRLVSVSGGGASATLTYDPLGRLYEVAGTSTTRFLYDGVDVIGEYSTSGTVLRRYVHGPGSDEPIVWYEGSGTTTRRWLTADARGSVIAQSTIPFPPHPVPGLKTTTKSQLKKESCRQEVENSPRPRAVQY